MFQRFPQGGKKECTQKIIQIFEFVHFPIKGHLGPQNRSSSLGPKRLP